jgi:TDG/mug DNA glycosylase family protein
MPRQPLADVVAPSLRVLFVGINPGLRSAALGHHFAGKGNPFWRLLHAAQLIDRPLGFLEERQLLDYGLGITNVVHRATRSADELSRDELRAGVAALDRKVRRLTPSVVALVGISIYRAIYGGAASAGPGAKAERFAGAELFVLPNPSGRNASYPGFEDKLVWYRKLRRRLDPL